MKENKIDSVAKLLWRNRKEVVEARQLCTLEPVSIVFSFETHWSLISNFCWFQISISTWADRWPRYTIIKLIKNYKSCWQSPRVKLFLNYWYSVQRGCILQIPWLIVEMCKIEKKNPIKMLHKIPNRWFVILPYRYKNCIFKKPDCGFEFNRTQIIKSC